MSNKLKTIEVGRYYTSGEEFISKLSIVRVSKIDLKTGELVVFWPFFEGEHFTVTFKYKEALRFWREVYPMELTLYL